MRRMIWATLLTAAAFGGRSAPAAPAEGREPAAILEELDALKLPDASKVDRDDQAAVMTFLNERQKAAARRAELIGELAEAAPGHDRLVKLYPERWSTLMGMGPGKLDAVKAEIDEVVAAAEDPALKAEGLYARATIPLRTGAPAAEVLEAVEAFAAAAPKDERAAILLWSAADRIEDPAEKTALLKRVLADYPESRVAAMIQGDLKRMEAVGKPFELAFTDAIKGTEVSMKALKGKVVVVDFWATWCGPCIAEMPTMKKLYAEYKDRGVEFIGVSLDSPRDEGGLDALKKYVAENEITWPQYYQGKGWESEFSSSWGISAIPALFIVDAEGNLHSTEARGQLEDLIPELLKKAKAKPEAGGGR